MGGDRGGVFGVCCRQWGDLQIYATTKDTLVCKDDHYQLQNTFDDSNLAIEISFVKSLLHVRLVLRHGIKVFQKVV